MRKSFLLLVSVSVAVLMFGFAGLAQDPESPQGMPVKFVNYDWAQKAKIGLSAWVAPEKAKRAQIAVFTSPTTEAEFLAAYKAMHMGGLVALKPVGSEYFEVYPSVGIEKILGLKVSTADDLKKAIELNSGEYEKFGIVVNAIDWTAKGDLLNLANMISAKNTKIIAWNPQEIKTGGTKAEGLQMEFAHPPASVPEFSR